MAKSPNSALVSNSALVIVVSCCAALLAGCQSAWIVRDPEYAAVIDRFSQATSQFDPPAEALAPPSEELAGPHSVEHYIAFARAQNPDIQAARKQAEAAANRVPQAASLPDPMIGVTTFPESVQTAAGQQEVLLTASQKLPWMGKLNARAELAEKNTQVARARLAAVELGVIEQVKRAYYELYFVDQALLITQADRELLLRLTKILESRLKTGKVSQRDVLRAQLEVSNRDAELIRLRQQLQSAQARLARRLHVSPDTPLRALKRLPPGHVPEDLEQLYHQAVAARPELHAELAAIERDRQAVHLARLDYYPDVTLGFTWIDTSSSGISPVANGRDPLLLGLSMNLPIYRSRLDAGVREAEARSVASARRYDSLRDQTLEEVKDLFARATSQQALLQLFTEDIIPKADQTLRVSRRAYEVGTVDFFQLIDDWRKLFKFQLMQKQLEAQLRQTLASLERVVGGTPSPEPTEMAPPVDDLSPPEALPPAGRLRP